MIGRQDIHGIVLVNKPSGLSSNAVLQRVKRLFGAKKAGHTGSLDPLATGMLPICLGEATKVCQYILERDKCYRVVGRLGVTTDTGDAMGQVIQTVDSISSTRVDITRAIEQFKGPIQQIPPMVSALKHQGKPLYSYARRGITIEREPRSVTIYSSELNAFDGVLFDMTVRCSKGTYIRSLVESIGEVLKVGAHVTALHRDYTAGFEQERMYTLDELQAKDDAQLMACLLPIENALPEFPWCILDDALITRLRQGQQVVSPVEINYQGLVKLGNTSQILMGIGECLEKSQLAPKRMLTY